MEGPWGPALFHLDSEKQWKKTVFQSLKGLGSPRFLVSRGNNREVARLETFRKNFSKKTSSSGLLRVLPGAITEGLSPLTTPLKKAAVWK